MSIKLRLALVLGLLLLGFLALLFLLRRMERQAAEQIGAAAREHRIESVQSWLNFTSRSLQQFTTDYAQSPELVKLLAQPAEGIARAQFVANLRNYGVHTVWILQADGTLIDHVATKADEPGSPPLPAEDFAKFTAGQSHVHFFAEAGTELLEVSGEPIPSGIRGAASSPPRRWLLAAQRWDDVHLRTLASLIESSVSLAKPDPAAPGSSMGAATFSRALTDWKGQTLRLLNIEYGSSEANRMIQADVLQSRVFLAFGLLVIVAIGLSLQGWVLRPLGWISESLARDEPAPLRNLSHENTELGRVAQLLQSSFLQRDNLKREVEERKRAENSLRLSEMTLRRTIEERAQLGRDLHDGVIQSLYAAGMGLAGVRALLRDEQTEATVRLDQTRAVLNDTIHDVRNFITGLEPEALKSHTFTQAITALLEFMQTIRPIRTTVQIDEALAGQLSLTQRIHALQIAREAISNALRHGEANQVEIILHGQERVAEFEIRDDGRGFTPSKSPYPGGLGLTNLAERARELGATLTVDSQPGRGTRVRFVIPLSSKPTRKSESR